MMDDTERARCATTARLLEAAGVVSLWGLAMSLIALLMLADGCSADHLSIMGYVIAALLGLPERYFAFRIRFDAGLFKDLARGTIASLPDLDHALNEAGLRHSAVPLRSLDKRLAGARQLIKRHCALVACQSVALAAALLNQWFR